MFTSINDRIKAIKGKFNINFNVNYKMLIVFFNFKDIEDHGYFGKVIYIHIKNLNSLNIKIKNLEILTNYVNIF
jgi:hypothetical protein